MKTILLILLTILVTACGGGGGGSTAALTGSNPASNQFDMAGTYNANRNASNLFSVCTHSVSGWSCAYVSSSPPAACGNTTPMGTFVMNQDGTNIQTFGLTVNGSTYHGTPFYDWHAVGSDQMSYSNGTVYLPNQNFQFDIEATATNRAVVTFATGCSLLFNKS